MRINRFEYFTGQALVALGGVALHQGNTVMGIVIISFAILWQTEFFVQDNEQKEVVVND